MTGYSKDNYKKTIPTSRKPLGFRSYMDLHIHGRADLTATNLTSNIRFTMKHDVTLKQCYKSIFLMAISWPLEKGINLQSHTQ